MNLPQGRKEHFQEMEKQLNESGEKKIEHIPAEIWRKGDVTVTKVFVMDEKAANVVLDPYLQTADVDLNNNAWPAQLVPSRFEIYKQKKRASSPNPMQENN